MQTETENGNHPPSQPHWMAADRPYRPSAKVKRLEATQRRGGKNSRAMKKLAKRLFRYTWREMAPNGFLEFAPGEQIPFSKG